MLASLASHSPPGSRLTSEQPARKSQLVLVQHSTAPRGRWLIKEVKRRTDVVGIFPNDASIVHLVGAVLLEQSDEWPLQHRYLSLETIAEIPAGEESLKITQLPPKAA